MSDGSSCQTFFALLIYLNTELQQHSIMNQVRKDSKHSRSTVSYSACEDTACKLLIEFFYEPFDLSGECTRNETLRIKILLVNYSAL